MAADLPRQAPRTYFLHGRALSEGPAAEAGDASEDYLPAACRNGGLWDGGTPFTLPGDQRVDSARAINFASQPLAKPVSILGSPKFSLYISSDVDVVPVAVRLLEIAPDGSSVLVTKGILNSTRREGMDRAVPLVPGEIARVAFHMEATAWRFREGFRIGISVNGSDFPNVWPTPRAGRITVHWGPELPVEDRVAGLERRCGSGVCVFSFAACGKTHRVRRRAVAGGTRCAGRQVPFHSLRWRR